MTIERGGQSQILEFPVDFLGQLSSSKTKDLPEIRYPYIFDNPMEGSLNSDVDIVSGDLLLTMDGSPARFLDQTFPLTAAKKGQTVDVTIQRDGNLLERRLQLSEQGKFEFTLKASLKDFEAAGFYKIIKKDYNLGQSIGVGLNQFTSMVGGYWAQLKLIVSPSTGAYKGVGGFKAIFDIFPASWNWRAFWILTAFLSIMLGVLNLLPIPALDGGHVVFLLYEMLSGRKPSDKFMGYAQTVGFFILIALVLFANGNDIFKAFFT